jgi:hypothetical protein
VDVEYANHTRRIDPMSFRTIAVTAMLLLSRASVTAQASDQIHAPQADAAVTGAFVGGSWRLGAAQGYYRLLVVTVGFEHIYQRLYLQRITNDEDEQPTGVASTVPIAEFSDTPGWSVRNVQFSLANAPQVLVIRAHSVRAQMDRTFRFRLLPDGGYVEQRQRE